MTPQRITLITLATTDMTAARAYYEKLGWVQDSAVGDDVTFYRLNGQFFGLYDANKLAEDIGRPVDLPSSGAVTLATNYATEAEVDAAVAAAENAGATVVSPAKKMHWGGYSATVAAPDGHLWEFAMNPFWPLNDDGAVIAS